MKKPCVIFVANRGYGLFSSRLILMKYFLSHGWTVVAAAAPDIYLEKLNDVGITIEPVPFYRGGLSLENDWKAFEKLLRVYKKFSPHLVHHFQAKPIIMGTIAAKKNCKAKIVNTVTGLGHAFIHGGIVKYLASLGYRLCLSRSDMTVFQNHDDLNFSLTKKWVSIEKTKLIIGSGVDIQRFKPTQIFDYKSTPRILMVARLLWQKGVLEFVESAKLLKKIFPNVLFQLVGERDLIHPDAVSEKWIQDVVDQEIIQYLGYITDIYSILSSSYLVVLPSYREGLPRILLEAAACGVPAVTTSAPGCREAVVDGETGWLVPPRDSGALAQAISRVIEDPVLRSRAGRSARKRIEKMFDIQIIAEQQIAVYREIGIQIDMALE